MPSTCIICNNLCLKIDIVVKPISIFPNVSQNNKSSLKKARNVHSLFTTYTTWPLKQKHTMVFLRSFIIARSTLLPYPWLYWKQHVNICKYV